MVREKAIQSYYSENHEPLMDNCVKEWGVRSENEGAQKQARKA